MFSEKHIELAASFIEGNAELRAALGLDSSALLEARPLGSGEHNINFSLWESGNREGALDRGACGNREGGGQKPNRGREAENACEVELSRKEGRDLRRVLRINLGTQTGNDCQVTYEAAALKALEASTRVPRVFYVDDTKRRIPHGAMVIEHRPGGWLDYGNAAAMEEAARIMADVHAVAPAADCPVKRADDPLQAYFSVCQAFYRNYMASPYVDSMVVGYVDEFFAHAKRALEVPHDVRDDAHILNTEPLASQFLIPECGAGDDEAATSASGFGKAAAPTAARAGSHGAAASACGRPCGAGSLIDWEKPVIGEVAQDIAYFLSPTSTIWDTDYVLNAAEREKFIGDYWRAVDGRFSQGRFEERLSAYVKMTCLLAITWSCNAVVEYNDPARELKTERTRRLLPVYLSEEYLANLLDNWFNAPLG